MLTGAVLVEVTFALPGLGSLLVDSVTFKDVPMVQGVAMLIAVLIVLVNLLTDLLYWPSTRGSASSGGCMSDVGGSDVQAHVAAPRVGVGGFSILVGLRSSSSPMVVVFASSARAIAPHDPNAQDLFVGVTTPERRHLARHGRPRSRHLFANRSWARVPRSSGRSSSPSARW